MNVIVSKDLICVISINSVSVLKAIIIIGSLCIIIHYNIYNFIKYTIVVTLWRYFELFMM